MFCFVLGSVNEWMRKKKNGWGGGEGGLCRVGGGFERVGGWMRIDLLQTIDHARREGLGRGLILFLGGLCRVDAMHFFFVELLDIVLFGSATTDLSRE